MPKPYPFWALVNPLCNVLHGCYTVVAKVLYGCNRHNKGDIPW